MTTYPVSAIREALLRAGCSLAMTDAAMYHLELLVAKPEATTCEHGCEPICTRKNCCTPSCLNPSPDAKEASADQPPQPSIEERVAKLEAIVHDGELRSRVIGLETRGDKLAREVYRMGGEVKLIIPSPESPTGGERECGHGRRHCETCLWSGGRASEVWISGVAPKAPDQPPVPTCATCGGLYADGRSCPSSFHRRVVDAVPPAPVGQPGVPAGPVSLLTCNWCGTTGLATPADHVCQGTLYGGDPANVYAGRFENFSEAEPSRPGTGEGFSREYITACWEEVFGPPTTIAPPAPGKPAYQECAKCGKESVFDTCVDCYDEAQGKPDKPLLSTRAVRIGLWDAISRVVEASGGNSGTTSVARQRAVVDVETCVDQEVTAECNKLHVAYGKTMDAAREALATRTAEVESLRAERDATRDKLGEEKLRRIEYGEEFGRVCEERDELRAAATAQVARIAELEAKATNERAGWVSLVGALSGQEALDMMMRFPQGSPESRAFSALFAAIANLREYEKKLGAPAPKATP